MMETMEYTCMDLMQMVLLSQNIKLPKGMKGKDLRLVVLTWENLYIR